MKTRDAARQNQQNDTSAQSDQSLRLRSVGGYGPKVSSCGHRRLWSDWTDAQTYLSLRWAHMSFCWCCHAVTHINVHRSFTLFRDVPWPINRMEYERNVGLASWPTHQTALKLLTILLCRTAEKQTHLQLAVPGNVTVKECHVSWHYQNSVHVSCRDGYSFEFWYNPRHVYCRRHGLGLSIWTTLIKCTLALHTLMTSEQPEKCAYFKNENNQKRHFFSFPIFFFFFFFWIKFEPCLEIPFHRNPNCNYLSTFGTNKRHEIIMFDATNASCQ